MALVALVLPALTVACLRHSYVCSARTSFQAAMFHTRLLLPALFNTGAYQTSTPNMFRQVLPSAIVFDIACLLGSGNSPSTCRFNAPGLALKIAIEDAQLGFARGLRDAVGPEIDQRGVSADSQGGCGLAAVTTAVEAAPPASASGLAAVADGRHDEADLDALLGAGEQHFLDDAEPFGFGFELS